MVPSSYDNYSKQYMFSVVVVLQYLSGRRSPPNRDRILLMFLGLSHSCVLSSNFLLHYFCSGRSQPSFSVTKLTLAATTYDFNGTGHSRCRHAYPRVGNGLHERRAKIVAPLQGFA
jgi:hypothetical protein